MIVEPAGLDQLSEITALQRRYDEHWFGEPENDADEVREFLELGHTQCIVRDGDRAVATGNAWRTGSSVVIDPMTDGRAVAAVAVDWLRNVAAPTTEVLSRDEQLREVLLASGWAYSYSTFDLYRAVESSWERPRPSWPDGVTVRAMEPADERRVHELIFRDAAWAEVRGHHDREFDEWRSIFLKGDRAEDRPLMAVRGDQPIGVVLPRLYSDESGWISQLAVARSERGRGLGRALLLTAFDRLARGGATRLGLGVLAENASALRLYVGVGLRVDREWQTFAAPG